MSVIDEFRLDGRVAVVTGASRNIGLEITRAFAEAGATVIAVARNAELLDERAAAVSAETGASIIPRVADVSDPESLATLIDRVHQEHDQIDVLVNNAYAAGNTFGVPVFEIPDKDWEETIAANVLGPYRLCRGFGSRMVAGRGGAIINVLSGSGFVPTRGITPYGSTKAALWMMTRYLAAEAAPKVRVNALCPGVTMSDTGGPSLNADIQRLLDQVPMGRAGQPQEVAPAAVYLASDAARYTTGALLVVNGGRHW
jgi:NAD(P)-dependent dehydrogenase (short-subunit alcohol dehydrogenase family)